MHSAGRQRHPSEAFQNLPHLAPLLVENPSVLCRDSQLVLLCTGVAGEFEVPPSFAGPVIDLRTELVAPPNQISLRRAA